MTTKTEYPLHWGYSCVKQKTPPFRDVSCSRVIHASKYYHPLLRKTSGWDINS